VRPSVTNASGPFSVSAWSCEERIDSEEGDDGKVSAPIVREVRLEAFSDHLPP